MTTRDRSSSLIARCVEGSSTRPREDGSEPSPPWSRPPPIERLLPSVTRSAYGCVCTACGASQALRMLICDVCGARNSLRERTKAEARGEEQRQKKLRDGRPDRAPVDPVGRLA